MGKPVVLVENLLSTVQFPDHTLTAEEEASGHEVFRVANGRRSRFDYWTSTTENDSTHLTCVFDRVRAFDMVVLDRGHNLAGASVILRSTLDATDFTGSVEEPFNGTLPSVGTPGHLDDPLGVRTEEGAWIKRLPLRIANAVRLVIPAMGTNLRPQIVGCWIGQSLELEYLSGGFDEDQDALLTANAQETDYGWLGHSAAGLRREGELAIRVPGFLAYDQVRYHLQGHFGARRPMWLVHDQAQADRALLVIRPAGQQGFALGGSRWGWRAGTISYVEWEPARVGA